MNTRKWKIDNIFKSLFLIIVFMQNEIKSQIVQDNLDLNFIRNYFQNNRLIDFQAKCLFEDGPCDFIGRWLKVRIKDGLLGLGCAQCTPLQSEAVLTIVSHFKRTRPDIYEKALINFLTDRELLEFLKREYLGTTHSGPELPQQSTIPQVIGVLEVVEQEILRSEESKIGARQVSYHENVVPGRSSYKPDLIPESSLLDIFLTPRTSNSFTIPILTKV